MRLFLRALLHPSVWLLLLCAGLGLLLARERAAHVDAEARNRTLLRAYAETVRRSGPEAPPLRLGDGWDGR